MAISYPLELPATPSFRTLELRARSTVGMARSPFTGQQQVFAHAGEWWELVAELPPMQRHEAEPWIATLTALRGMLGTFLCGDPLGAEPRGVATGSPQVNGSGQTGHTLATKGWTPSVTQILKAGDWLQIDASLYKVVQDANSNGSGLASVEVFPRLRTHANNAAIIVENARGRFRLAANEQPWEIDTDRVYHVAFAATEVVP